MRIFIVMGVALSLAAGGDRGAETGGEGLRSPNFLEQARKGFDLLYNQDQPEARQTFAEMEKRFPSHPGPPLYKAIVEWMTELLDRQELELDLFVSPGHFTKSNERQMPRERRAAFAESMDRAQRLCEQILQADPTNLDAAYFIGTIYGVRASFAITVDHDRSEAFRQGKRAYQHHREILEKDQTYYDAYMGVGLYEYIVDNLPWYIKWLAVIIGYRGSEETGFEYLKLASDKALFVADDARILLMVLYVREKRYAEALALARYLHGGYPRNYILHLNVAQILEKMGQEDEATTEYERVARRVDSERPNYHLIPLASFRLEVASRFMNAGRFDLARSQLEKLLNKPETKEGTRALSHLRLGQVLDLQGKREEAVGHYREVLKLQAVERSHDHAEKYLKQPYRKPR